MNLFEVTNQTPKWLLAESAEEKATHLEHLEDLVFNQGAAGAQTALNYLASLRSMFAEGTGSTSRVTVKWDGAPAIHAGIDPADGQFFVGTKSIFAKTEPKLCKTQEDIKRWYSESPGLAKKLSLCLQYLPELGIQGVVKGDLLFTAGELVTANINGQDCITFTPNTITYAVPADSELAARMQNAKLGIIFHTNYVGNTVATMQAEFGYSVAGLKPSRNVWYDDAYYKDYTGIASLTDDENRAIKQRLRQAAVLLKSIDSEAFNTIVTNPEFSTYIKPYVNNLIKTGQMQIGEPSQFLEGFMEFYRSKKQAEIDKLKGGVDSPAVQARLQKIQTKEKFLQDHRQDLIKILELYQDITAMKLAMIYKLRQVESIAGTFIKTNDGFRVSKPEGFVAIGHDGGAIKLVDRLEFSRENFLATKAWTKP